MSHDVPTEPDRIPAALLVVTAVVTAIAIAGSALAVWLLADRDATGGGARPPGVVLPVEVDAITTEPFAGALTAERVHAAQLEALDRWSWGDRAHRVARAPISIAIDNYLQHQPTSLEHKP